MCSADLNDSRCECDRPILAPDAEARRPLVVVVVVRIRLWFRFREYRGRQMQFILVKRNALPPPRGDQGPSHPTQNVTKALFGLILWRNDGWIPFLLRTLLCLCGEYEMSTHCYVHILLVCLFSDALTRILRFAILCSTKVSAVRLSIAIDFLSSALFVSGFNKR